MQFYLFIAAVVIIACILLNKLSNKLGIPMLIGFILLGMVFGSDGLLKIPLSDYSFVEKVCSTALIFIMFYGGFGTKWSEGTPVAGRAILLSTVGVVVTAILVGLFCHFVMGLPLLEALLLGSILGCTDAASVFSILRLRRLNLRENTASLLEIESGSNDPCAYMLTIIVLSLMKGSSDVGNILYMAFSQIVYGGGCGIIIAFLSGLLLKKYKFSTAGFAQVFVLAIAILSYSIPQMIGGNGYLSAYIVGIYLGNIDIYGKRDLVSFFDGITGLMQMVIFFLLGLLSFPSQMPTVLLPALLVFVFITLVARPITVFLLLTPLKTSIRQSALVSWAGLRGASSIVFAVFAYIGAPHLANDIFHIVFVVVLLSIPVQGSLIPFISKKLGLIDNNIDVMRTFSDYSDELPIKYVQLVIPPGNHWVNKRVRDLMLPPDTILVVIKRDGGTIVPKGNTVVKEGDQVVLSAREPVNFDEVSLTEKRLIKNDPWIDKSISKIDKPDNLLIIMIQRGRKLIIPSGDTVLKLNDVLVINHIE